MWNGELDPSDTLTCSLMHLELRNWIPCLEMCVPEPRHVQKMRGKLWLSQAQPHLPAH